MRDIQSQATNWINVYAAAGIALGAGIIIQNKKCAELLVLESANNPGDDVYDGRVLTYLREIEVGQGSPGVWVRNNFGGIRFFVQEV